MSESCDLADLVLQLVNNANGKIEECECTDSMPYNQSDLCGDGDGLVSETMDAVQAIIDAGCVLEDPSYPKPSIPDCVDYDFFTEAINWVSHLTCDDTCEKTIEHVFQGTQNTTADSSDSTTKNMEGDIEWFEDEDLFGPADYTVRRVVGNATSFAVIKYILAGGIARNPHLTTYSFDKSCDFDSSSYGGYTYRVWARAQVVVEDCNGNRTYHNVHGDDGECTEDGVSFSISSSSKIGVRGITSITIQDNEDGSYLSPDRFGSVPLASILSAVRGTLELSPCPNLCSPQVVTDTYCDNLALPVKPIRIYWNDPDDCCVDEHKVYVKKVNTCSDCSDTSGMSLVGTTSDGSPYKMDLQSSGFYCFRVDAIKNHASGSVTATGDPFCCNLECVNIRPELTEVMVNGRYVDIGVLDGKNYGGFDSIFDIDLSTEFYFTSSTANQIVSARYYAVGYDDASVLVDTKPVVVNGDSVYAGRFGGSIAYDYPSECRDYINIDGTYYYRVRFKVSLVDVCGNEYFYPLLTGEGDIDADGYWSALWEDYTEPPPEPKYDCTGRVCGTFRAPYNFGSSYPNRRCSVQYKFLTHETPIIQYGTTNASGQWTVAGGCPSKINLICSQGEWAVWCVSKT